MNEMRFALALGTVAMLVAACGPSDSGGRPAETYRLIHAIGNTEREVDRGLSRTECERRRDDLKDVATALGAHNEETGRGSITCLPESVFR